MAAPGYENRLSEESGLCKLIRGVCTDGMSERKNGNTEIDIAALFNRELNRHSQCVPLAGEKEKSGFSTADNLIDSLLLEPEIKGQIKSRLAAADAARDRLLDSLEENAPFPSGDSARAYRNVYTQLLQEMYSQLAAFEDFGEAGDQFLLEILNIDISFREGNMYASLWAPAAVDALLRVYGYIEEYIDVVSSWDLSPEEAYLLESNYQAVIISKALRCFRWKIVNDGELFQAAIPAAIPLTDDMDRLAEKIWTPGIPVRSMADYSSYEGIGELRLFDKIIYELERKTDAVKNAAQEMNYHILLVGDILERPIGILCQAVEQWIGSQKRSACDDIWDRVKLHLEILTHNVWETKTEISITPHINYVWKEYKDQLSNGKVLDQLILKNDWIFLLDACDLYNSIYVQEESGAKMRERLTGGADRSVAEQQQILYSLVLTGCCGTIAKEVSKTFIRYFANQLRKANREKSAYVYVSDLDAISGLDFSDEHFIRIERYNEKEFLILRIPGRGENPLPETEERKIIIMNLWQVIKHCTVRNIDCYLNYFGLEDIPTAIRVFRDTLIGVEYGQWKKELKFYYALPDDLAGADPVRYEDRLSSWVKTGIMPYFKNRKGDLFYNYFVKAFSTFIYSDTKSVDDMLFLHLFVNKHHLLNNVVFAGEDNSLSRYQSKRCKYSQKQFFGMAMEDYDTSSEMFMYKYRKLDLMERADSELRKTIFKRILDSCRRNQYEDSYLQINCRKMI